MAMEELFNEFGWRITLESAALPDGREKKGVRIHRCDSAHILAFPDEKHILLLREFRPFYGEYISMIPSGKVDKEMDPIVAAQRELQEETGFRAKNIEHYCTVHGSESIDIAHHIFIARDLVHDPIEQDEDEVIEVQKLNLQEALRSVLASPKIHVISGFALLRFMHEFNSHGVIPES